MATFIFTDRLLPHHLPLTLSHQPKVAIVDAEGIPDTILSIAVTDGEIRVEANLASYGDTTWEALFFFAQDLARTVAEVASISQGVAYIPILDHVIEPDGNERGLVLADRGLGKLMTIFADYSFEEVFDIVAVDVSLMRALSDVVVMLTWSHYAPIAAGRVAESILRMLAGGRSQADWQKMRATLRVDRAYLQLLTDHAMGPRHGDRRRVDGPINRQLAERAWTLMNRYLAYRLAGEQPLDHQKFPLLRG